jgi:4-carboxymuconolactone decarboxylase
MTDATPATGPSGAQKAFGDFALAFVGFTGDVLFGQVWTRPELSPRERSLITVATLTAGRNTEQLTF